MLNLTKHNSGPNKAGPARKKTLAKMKKKVAGRNPGFPGVGGTFK